MRSKSSPSTKSEKVYGFLAVMKLCQIAGFDYRLGNAARRILMILQGYSGPDGRCFPSVSKIAESLGMANSAVSKQIRNLEKFEYLKSTRRHNPETGATCSNIYEFNLALAKEHYKKPEVFAKEAIGEKDGPITSGSYTPLNPLELQSPIFL
ncbi:MAG: helix-turn-helix domain-containing protein [Alphaproteobacteria bacterium]|nr:helix-turn-helix domain-containing protein [Alphaproteobacteria bacterium]